MADEIYSDYESSYSCDEDEYQELVSGAANEQADEDIVVPADPDVGEDEYSDAEDKLAESEDEEYVQEVEEEEEKFDMKAASSYNTEEIIIKPDERLTSHILSKYEMTEIISIRATQISQYNNCMVPIDDLDDPIKQAKRELMARKCPLILVRPVGERKNKETEECESYVEHWNPNQMCFAMVYNDV